MNDDEQNHYGIVCWYLYLYLLIKAKQTNKQGTVHIDISKVGGALFFSKKRGGVLFPVYCKANFVYIKEIQVNDSN